MVYTCAVFTSLPSHCARLPLSDDPILPHRNSNWLHLHHTLFTSWLNNGSSTRRSAQEVHHAACALSRSGIVLPRSEHRRTAVRLIATRGILQPVHAGAVGGSVRQRRAVDP